MLETTSLSSQSLLKEEFTQLLIFSFSCGLQTPMTYNSVWASMFIYIYIYIYTHISETANLLGFSHTTISRVLQRMVWKRENIQWATVVWTKMPCWCQRRMVRLVRDDRKATVTQITTRYNQHMQNTISERTTRRTLKQMGYSSRRPHRVLLSAKNRKRRIQFTQAHQHWTIEDWKNVAWSDESRFLLRHKRTWHKEHESTDPSCLVSMVQAGAGVMVWGMLWDT